MRAWEQSPQATSLVLQNQHNAAMLALSRTMLPVVLIRETSLVVPDLALHVDLMPTRREFLQQAALLSGAAAWPGAFPAAIAKAMAIDPEPGSTFLDAEHVVILMQENRSFDHTFGTLQGVRGFNDPRAISLPNGNPVWVQTNPKGESYVPFRLNIKDTNATWAGCLPHRRTDQVDARNGGRYDRWLAAKRSGEKQYADMPLTLGYYTREGHPLLLRPGRRIYHLRSTFLLGAHLHDAQSALLMDRHGSRQANWRLTRPLVE